MTEQQRPNVVVFMTDDQGYGDLSCLGCTDFRTPHLDALAGSGCRFTDWYSNSPVCSPSRAALLTGRYPVHAGVRSILAGHRQATGLSSDVPTIATALRRLGYRTGLAGKWHLGVDERCRPHEHGFDEWFGFLAGCIDYYSHLFYYGGHDPVHDLWDNNREVWRNGAYFTEMVTERAVGFVQRSAGNPEPFFLYVGYNAPHYPMHAPAKYLDRFPHLPPDRRIMAAMLSAVDDGVGEIVAALDRAGVRENTIVFFQSDNGPSRETRNWLDGTTDPYYGGTTGALKGHKFSLFEGGIRVPAILSWPARVPAGQVVREPAAAMDLFPTLLAAAGGASADYTLDGRDILPLLADGTPLPERAVCWEQGGQTAVRRGDWKLVLHGQLVEGVGPEGDVHLSHVRDDPGERVNLREECPAVCAELAELATDWRAGIDRHWDAVWAGGAAGHTGHPSGGRG